MRWEMHATLGVHLYLNCKVVADFQKTFIQLVFTSFLW